ncbi:hypothetical protein [Deinococcus hopiensis]|nr:hypothetical protein [Deinococcus hopiensis]
MEVVQYSEVALALQVNGETVRTYRRTDWYVKPGTGRKPDEHVEIWCLQDGREVLLSRRGTAGGWTARWRWQ